ncbi:MAG: protein-glutamine gamma-glutamyltransferase [Verrucomicrobiota bacterium]
MPRASSPSRRISDTRDAAVRVRWNLHTISLTGIVLAMGYAGAVQNNGAAYLLCFLTAVLAAMSWLRARQNLRGLQVSLRQVASGQAGGLMKLPLEFQTTQAESVWAVEVLVVGESGRWSFIEQISNGQNVRLTLPIMAPESGTDASLRLRVRSSYPLGLFSAEREIVLTNTRRIHPRPEGTLPLPEPDRSLGAASVVAIQTGGHPGREGDDFAGVREWQPGDSLRHVDWRAVARGRPLMVKQWASGAGSAVTLDWSSLPLAENEKGGQIARWIEECEASGVPYALRLPNVDIPVNLGPPHARQCLDALAAQSASLETLNSQQKSKRLPPGHEHSIHLPRGPLMAMCGMLMLVALPLLDFASAFIPVLLACCIAWRLLLKRPLAVWMPMLVLILGAVMIQLIQGQLISMEGGIAVLVVLLGAKLLESRTPHDFQVLGMVGWFLCLCSLLAEQSLSRSLWTLAVFAGIAMCMVRFRRGSPGFMPALRLTGTMLGQALPVAVVVFFIFPRGSLEFLARFGSQRTHQTGISNSLEPGRISKIAMNDDVAFRVEFPTSEPPPNESRYWRCLVLWDCNGLSWERGPRLSGSPKLRLAQRDDVKQIISLEPHGQQWLPSLDLPVRAIGERGTMLPDLNDMIVSDEPVNSLYRMEVISRLKQDSSDISESQRMAALSLPRDLSPRVRELAKSFQKGSTSDVATAQAAIEHLRALGFRYTLEPGVYEGPGALDDFLFVRRVGFCEHFSASFATLMRAAGIPSRIVIGYMGGEWSTRGGYMIVRQSHAHAWTELWLEGTGWTRVDPTAALVPARMSLDPRTLLASMEEQERQRSSFIWQSSQAIRLWWDDIEYRWYNTVISFDEEAQIAWLNWLGLGQVRGRELLLLSIGFIVLTLASLGYWLSRPARSADPWVRAWQSLGQRLAKLGVPPRQVHEGPLDFAKRAAAQRPALAGEIQRLAQIYAEARYGHSGADRTAFERAVKALR